jgi:hypothetical protein
MEVEEGKECPVWLGWREWAILRVILGHPGRGRK